MEPVFLLEWLKSGKDHLLEIKITIDLQPEVRGNGSEMLDLAVKVHSTFRSTRTSFGEIHDVEFLRIENYGVLSRPSVDLFEGCVELVDNRFHAVPTAI